MNPTIVIAKSYTLDYIFSLQNVK